MVSLQALRNNLTRQRRSLPLLYLTLTLLVVQVMDLHFHVHPSPDRQQSAAVATAHAQHADTHATHHEDTGAVDLASAELWKNPDQGWDIIALFAAAFVLLSISIRGAPDRRLAKNSPRNQPAFLRPSLRAPPR